MSLQENNLIAIIDLATATVTRYIDAGTSVHGRADLATDGDIAFNDHGFVGQLQPDAVCLLADGRHFVTANEGVIVFVRARRRGGGYGTGAVAALLVATIVSAAALAWTGLAGGRVNHPELQHPGDLDRGPAHEH